MNEEKLLNESKNTQTANDQGVVSSSLLDVWKCPYCKYIVSDTEYLQYGFDFGCPRCMTSFIKFTSDKI